MKQDVIYLDSRVGSRELAPLLSRNHGIRTSLCTLDSGDIAFLTADGFLERPKPSFIGIERKTLSDLVGSLLRNRISKQVTGMLEDFDLAWILVEGIFRAGADDVIEVPRSGGWIPSRSTLTYSQLNGWLVRYDVMGGGKIRRWRTSSLTESAAWIASTYRWCQKPWKKHQAITIEKMAGPEKALLFRASELERHLASIPKLGTKKARMVSRRFREKTPRQVANASEDEWVETGIGKKTAAAVYTWYRTRRP